MTRLKAIRLTALACVLCVSPIAAMAEFAPITTRVEFLQTVAGKNLTMLGIKMQVSPDGQIAGRAMGWDVTGNWKWQGGYFCRDMNWGGDDLGYNCQAVSVKGNKVRFQSDKGTGQSADLRIR